MWRRRLAPVVLVIAVGLLVSRTCTSRSAQVELRFDLGQAAERVRRLEVDLLRDPAAAPVGQWNGQGGRAPMRPWRLSLAPGSYQLRVRADMADGRQVRFERAIEVTEEASITVPLEQGLQGP